MNVTKDPPEPLVSDAGIYRVEIQRAPLPLGGINVGMRTSGINHVSIHANDLEASVRFYVELLDAEILDTPNFGVPVQWLGLGETQLHVFVRDAEPQSYHHFGIT